MKASVLLAAAIVVARLMRGSAFRRHSFWSGVFAALLLLPALGVMLPSIDVKIPRSVAVVPPVAEPSKLDTSTPVAQGTASIAVGSLDPVPQRTNWTPSIAELLMALWLAGAGVALGALVLSLVRVSRLAKRGRLIVDPEWRSSADRIARELGVARPIRLIADASVTTPMAAGFRKPTIFLPASAGEWTID
jgi:beta-lactamase regulating signal transducer with metallopeptidase domain